MLGDGLQHPDHHHYRGALLFHIRFKCAFRPDLRCRGRVVMIVIITAGHAGGAEFIIIMIIIIIIVVIIIITTIWLNPKVFLTAYFLRRRSDDTKSTLCIHSNTTKSCEQKRRETEEK